MGLTESPAVTVSVVVPVYNEISTVRTALDALAAKRIDGYDLQLIIVESNSTDGSREVVLSYGTLPAVRILLEETPRGKGHAVRAGLAVAAGEIVIIQDADLEYDPSDYHTLLGPLIQGKADVVYGSRFLGAAPHRVLYFWHSVGNRLLTLLSNCLTNINLTDMETCYKAFRRDVIQSIPIEEDRFGFEPEITVKVAKRRLRIYEVGISYWGRTYEEGKKISWLDGLRAAWCLLKYSFTESSGRTPYGTPAHEPVSQSPQNQASNVGR